MKERKEPAMESFHAFGDDATVLGVGNLDIENAQDRITLQGDVVLTRDRTGLLLARQLQAVLNSVVQALEADKHLPEKIEVKPAATVRNPLA